MDVNKDKLIQVYGIDDDNFVEYLKKFNTLTKIINIGIIEYVPKEKLREVYNSFIYYKSIGHDLDTIVNDTLPKIKQLFFSNETGNYGYRLQPFDENKIIKNYSVSTVSNRICQLRIRFRTNEEIPKDTLLFELAPAPYNSFWSKINTSNGDIVFSVALEGIYTKNVIPINTDVDDTIVYIIGK